MDYCTLQDVYNELYQALDSTANDKQDAIIEDMISAASELIDNYCGRTFAQFSGVILLDGNNGSILNLGSQYTPVQSISTLAIDGQVIDANAWAWYDNGRIKFPVSSVYNIRTRSYQQIFPAGLKNIAVTGVFGYATLPPTIKRACIMQTLRWWNESKGSYSDVVGSEDGSQIKYTLALAAEIRQMLALHMRVGVGTG